MNPVKLVHLIRSLEPGGCEHFLIRALPEMEKHNVQNHLIALQSAGALSSRLSSAGISVESISMRHWFDLSGYLRLYLAVKSAKPDIITTYLFHADAIGRLWLRLLFPCPVIPFLRTTYNHRRYVLARLFERLTSRLVPKYLANSPAVKSFYTDSYNIPTASIQIISNGINIAAYQYSKQNRLSARHSLSLPGNAFAIICVANFHPNKGHRHLLQSFIKLHRTFTDMRLLLVGDGEERSRLIALAQASTAFPAIKFLGLRRDIPNLLQTADVFVLPTQFEGMSNAILEAMASSLPVITTDIPENRQIISHNQNGLLYPVNDDIALETAIQSLYTKPKLRHRLGAAACLSVKNRFSLDTIASEWASFYRQMAS